MSNPTPEQLRTLCEKTVSHIEVLRKRLANLHREIASTEQHIIAAQGVIAALQVAIGLPYDPLTVPLDLQIEPE